MDKLNALKIQEILKKKTCVSIPWIQKTFSFDYKDAKEFLRLLIKRGWVESRSRGVEFAVLKENLRLRKLDCDEVDLLIEDITTDCVSALRCMEGDPEEIGATFSDIEADVHGTDDTHAAIKVLTGHRLIYKAGDCYYPAVSKQTVRVLDQVANAKRHTELRRRITGKEDFNKSLREFFDVLFEDE